MHQRLTACTTAPAAAWLTLPGIPASVRSARSFVRDTLAGCPRAEDLVLAVSELATNALDWSASGCGGGVSALVPAAHPQARGREGRGGARADAHSSGPESSGGVWA